MVATEDQLDSSKAAAARQRRVPIVGPAFVAECLRAGRLLPTGGFLLLRPGEAERAHGAERLELIRVPEELPGTASEAREGKQGKTRPPPNKHAPAALGSVL